MTSTSKKSIILPVIFTHVFCRKLNNMCNCMDWIVVLKSFSFSSSHHCFILPSLTSNFWLMKALFLPFSLSPPQCFMDSFAPFRNQSINIEMASALQNVLMVEIYIRRKLSTVWPGFFPVICFTEYLSVLAVQFSFFWWKTSCLILANGRGLQDLWCGF